MIERREPALPGALQPVTFAKACSGLSEVEFAEVDRVIRQTTIDKFGPVRGVHASLVFELGFEGIDRIPLYEADTPGHLVTLLALAGAGTMAHRGQTP